MNINLKVLFFGSSDYCMPVLESLYKNFSIAAVITRPDKPVGRKGVLTPSKPKIFATSHNIPVFTPKNKKELMSLDLAGLNPDKMVGVVADFGLFIPKEIFNLPKYKTLNIHFSRLPEFRGPSPVQYTILNGAKNACISVFILEEKMDTGDVIWQKEIPLDGKETTLTLYQKLFSFTAKNLAKILLDYSQKKLNVKRQDHKKATFTKLFTKEDGFIPLDLLKIAMKGKNASKKDLENWPVYKRHLLQILEFSNQKFVSSDRLSAVIDCAIRAFTPWPGLWTEIKSEVKSQKSKVSTKRVKILRAHVKKLKTQNSKLKELLVLDIVQLEGKKPVAWKDFEKGYLHF